MTLGLSPGDQHEELPAICITANTASSLVNTAAPEIPKEVPVTVPSWMSRLEMDRGELTRTQPM